ncbi:MAG: 4-alpha-glucanotransferase, partial [Candidatus Binatia bacterium]
SILALLPLSELAPGEASPYNALSSFALDPLHLCPAAIPELRGRPARPPKRRGRRHSRVDRSWAREWKEPLFLEAFERFEALPEDHPRRRAFRAFRRSRSSWLGDYSLFRGLLEENEWRSWKDWPEALRRRDPGALEDARARLARRLRHLEYLQFTAEEAWRRVHDAAARQGVALMGDLPFAPSENSADVWANPEVFDISRSIGAPPDDFSATGQRWGLPMIRWGELRSRRWNWLRSRARRMAELYDSLRIDHVVGLFRTFYFVGDSPGDFDPADPARQREQGREVLEVFREEVGASKLVAEDLGTVPPFVRETLTALDVPGYKILRWERTEDGFVDPATYPDCSVATTGTHDTTTLGEWWAKELVASERRELIALLEAGGAKVAFAGTDFKADPAGARLRRAVLERLYRSPSRAVILPIQDLFGWRERINVPGVIGEGNWSFRLPLSGAGLRSDRVLRREVREIRRLIDASGRLRRMDTSMAGRRV